MRSPHATGVRAALSPMLRQRFQAQIAELDPSTRVVVLQAKVPSDATPGLARITRDFLAVQPDGQPASLKLDHQLIPLTGTARGQGVSGRKAVDGTGAMERAVEPAGGGVVTAVVDLDLVALIDGQAPGLQRID